MIVMRCSTQKVAEIAKKHLIADKYAVVSYGYGILTYIAEECWPNSHLHPLIAMNKVLNALDRHCATAAGPLFTKHMIRVETGHKRLVSRLVRCFILTDYENLHQIQ